MADGHLRRLRSQLAAAVNKIRETLGDSAENPRFVETLPKRGYRFIGKIRPEPPVVLAVPDAQPSVKLATVPRQKRGPAGSGSLAW